MFCQNCGKEFQDGVGACPHCGAPVSMVSQPAPVQTTSDPGTTPMVLGILSIVFAGLIGLVLGIIGLKKAGPVLAANPENGRAKAGKITSIIGLVLSILAILAFIAVIALGVFAAATVEEEDLQQLEQQLQQLDSSASADVSTGQQSDTSTTPSSTEQPSAGTESSASSSASAGGSAGTDYTGGQSFDSWAAECTNSANQPTLYAITELKGWQLETLLQQLGYEWRSDINTWVRNSDLSFYGMYGPSGALTDEEIAKGDKGGVGTQGVHVLEAGPYSSAREALNQMSQIVTEDVMFTDDEQQGAAVVYGPSMKQYLTYFGPSLEGRDNYYAFYIFSDEAIEAGMFDQVAGQSGMGNSVSEIWENLTGGAVGDYVANNN